MLSLLASAEFLTGLAVGAGGVVLLYLVVNGVLAVLRPLFVAMATDVELSVMELIGMRMRRTPAMLVVMAAVIDRKRGGELSLITLESAYMAFSDEIREPMDLLNLLEAHGEDAFGGRPPVVGR